MQLTNIQLNTVNQILSHYSAERKTKVDFKSPTGSGKTLMASYFISALIERNPSEQFIFVIATPSSSSLPEFFEKKLNKYKADLPFSKFEAEYIQSPSSSKTDKTEGNPVIIAQQNKIYIFGKSSFGKGRILSERGIIDSFVQEAVETKNYKLIYIRDEAHIGDKTDNSEETKKFENLMQNNAHFVLKMTATPNYADRTIKRVILAEKDLNDPSKNEGKFLLKTTPILLLKHDMADVNILADAIQNFKKIQTEYQTLNISLRPCMLLQVTNEPTNAEEKREFKENIANIKKTLSDNNLAWVQYFGNTDKDSNRVYGGKFTLEEITENNSEIAVVIFKIGPSTGWDIPRACMLVQLRNVCSSSLNTQTIGRIKRNSYQNLERNEITDKYFVYSNVRELDKDFYVYKYNVKDKFKGEEFARIEITNKKELTKTEATEKLKTALKKYLTDEKNHILQRINESFVEKEGEFIYKKVVTVANGNVIYTAISNPFIFLRDYKRLIAANKFIYDKIKSTADSFYNKEIKNLDCRASLAMTDKGTTFPILPEYFYTILLENYKKELSNLINKHKQFKPTYQVKLAPYKPETYIEMFDGEPRNKERTPKNTYLFDIQNGELGKQPLDSEPEKTIFNKIYDFAEDNEGSIKIWAKNLTSSNVSGEYLDDSNNTRHSYFDFVIKFSNGTFLYIEVKGKNDIDPEKTAMLKEAYKDYFVKKEKSRSLFEKPLVICVWQVGGKDVVDKDTFYDKEKITAELDFLSIEELLNTISKIPVVPHSANG